MTARTIQRLVIQLLGLYLIVSSMMHVFSIVSQLMYDFTGYNLYVYVGMLAGLLLTLLIGRHMMLRTDFIINMLRLSHDDEEQGMPKTNVEPVFWYRLLVVFIGGYTFTWEFPTLISQLYFGFERNVGNKMIFYDNSFSMPSLLYAAICVFMSIIIILYSNKIGNWLYRKSHLDE